MDFPSLQCYPLDRIRVESGEPVAAANLVTRAMVPTSSTYSTARQGPTSLAWAGRPRSGRGSRFQWAVGPIEREINLTFSPLISSYTFNFYSFRNRSIHRACFIVTAQLPMESDNHNVPLYFETDSLTLGPLLSGNIRLYHKTHVDYVFSEHTGR